MSRAVRGVRQACRQSEFGKCAFAEEGGMAAVLCTRAPRSFSESVLRRADHGVTTMLPTCFLAMKAACAA